MFDSIFNKIEKQKVVGVIRSSHPDKALSVAKAFVEGGIKIIEITLENKDSLRVIEEVSKIDGITVAAGSIITTSQAEQAIMAGAKFLTSPVLEMNLVRLSKSYKVPVITSASTTNEAYQAWKSGVKYIKLFPAVDMGGARYIKDILKPMPFLKLIPTSGIDLDDYQDYLDAGAVAVGLGKMFYKGLTYEQIVEKTKAAVEMLEN